MEPEWHAGVTLHLADGTVWYIRAGDPQAARVVTRLSQVMQLRPATDGHAAATQELLIVTGDFARISGHQRAVCVVAPPSDETMLTIAATQAALAVAIGSQARGGVLLHGALAVHQDRDGSGQAQGVLLAGPGTVGKTTASNRLLPPWHSLCDDATLVVRDAEGRYWAHPWPTWSRFYSYNDTPAPGGSWHVERAVPLHGIFFLSQADEDRMEPRSPGQAMAMLVEVVEHVTRPIMRSLAPRQIQALRREQLSIAQAMARVMPVHTLHVSLSGAFWTEIERALPKRQMRDASPALRAQRKGGGRLLDVESWLDDGLLHFAYRGPSMNPTLREPDLVDVRPYGTRPIQRGDAIYYRQPEDDRMVVHRVVGVSSGTVRTRGDNNPVADPYLLHVEDIRGQVVGAQRGSRRRSIAGGWRGMGMAYGLRLWHYIRRAIAACLGGLYRALARSGVLVRLLPKRLRPRVVVFDSRVRPAYKLLMGSREIARYDYRDRRWQIRMPLRLLVQEAELPHPELPQPVLARRMSAQRDAGK